MYFYINLNTLVTFFNIFKTIKVKKYLWFKLFRGQFYYTHEINI